MKDMLAHEVKGKIFTKLDLREACYQVQIKAGDENCIQLPIELFSGPGPSFQPAGVPAMFMQLINEVLHEHLFKGILVYLDDILIYTETMDEHVKLVETSWKSYWQQLHVKFSKCKFHQPKLDYLGYQISHYGMKMGPEKVKVVLEWEVLHTQK